jgi:AraC family transcriptional regulator of adaptative response / DNA-3-methyladenine glycosylase II
MPGGGSIIMSRMRLTREQMLDSMYERDAAANGRFLVAVKSTGIFCLPSCPARKPLAENVAFYTTPDEAAAGGFRACRRCRPDHFYKGYDADLAELTGLLDLVRADPAAFRSVQDLAARAGSGMTRLNQLFRRYLQATPAGFLGALRVRAACEHIVAGKAGAAEAGFAVGFESASTYHENFRRMTGMSPGAWRALGSRDDFELRLPGDFLVEYPRRMLARDPESVAERVTGRTLVKAFAHEGRAARLELAIEGRHVRAEVKTRGRVGPPLARVAHAIAVRMLALGADPNPFRRHVQRQPRLAPLIAGRDTLRIPQTADVFEGVAWAIIGQQINLRFASALRRSLITLCGRPAGAGFIAHPTPAEVAAIDYADLTSRKFSRQKAAYLIDFARRITAGDFDLEGLSALPPVQAEKALREVRGIGPWSANYLMLRSFGFADCVPVGDTGLVTALEVFFALDHRPNAVETHALMQQFAPWRSLASYHLWMSLGDIPGP